MDETLATIIGIITIFGPAIAAIAFILKYKNDVNNLKKEVRNLKKDFQEHPLIMMFKQWEINKGGFLFLNDILKNSKVEKED